MKAGSPMPSTQNMLKHETMHGCDMYQSLRANDTQLKHGTGRKFNLPLPMKSACSFLSQRKPEHRTCVHERPKIHFDNSLDFKGYAVIFVDLVVRANLIAFFRVFAR